MSLGAFYVIHNAPDVAKATAAPATEVRAIRIAFVLLM
jgi:hypothetical protein